MQSILAILLFILTAMSCQEEKKHLVAWVLYLQTILLVLANFNNAEKDNQNYQGLNVLAVVFSVILCIYNTFIASMIMKDIRVRYTCTVVIYIAVFGVVIATNFIFIDINYQTFLSLGISISYGVVLVPFFFYLTNQFNEIQQEHLKFALDQRQKYCSMFDCLQEGIIIVNNQEINYMN